MDSSNHQRPSVSIYLHAIVLLAITIPLTSSAHTGRADLLFLPTLGGNSSTATAVNNAGQVVGNSSTGGNFWHAFLWQRGRGMMDLGTLGKDTYANDINDEGWVVGTSRIEGNNDRSHAFLWQANQGMQDLGSLDPPNGSSIAYHVNNIGQIVGMSSAKGVAEDHAFVWQLNRMEDLGTLGEPLLPPTFTNSAALGINDHSDIVGYSDNPHRSRHAFYKPRGLGMQDLGTLGNGYYDESRARAINDTGQVVGYSTSADHSNKTHAFLWNSGSGGLHDLGTLGGDDSRALSINEAGQIVGTSETATGQSHAFIWRNNRMTDLNSVTGSFHPYTATDINDYAQIVGAGNSIHTLGQTRGYLLTLHPDWVGGNGKWDDPTGTHWDWGGTGTAPATIGYMHEVVIRDTNATVSGSKHGHAKSLVLGGDAQKRVALDLNDGKTILTHNAMIRAGGTLEGTGTLQAHNVIGEEYAHIAPGKPDNKSNAIGLIRIIGETQFGPNSLFEMDVGRLLYWEKNDKIIFDNDVVLNNSILKVGWWGNQVPLAGESFDLFDWKGDLTGKFEQIILPDIDSSLLWDTTELYNSGKISIVSAVPLPNTVGLFVSGLMFLSSLGHLCNRHTSRKSHLST